MTWTDSSQAWDWVGHGLAEIFDEPGRETRDSTLASAPRSYCVRQTVRMQAPKRLSRADSRNEPLSLVSRCLGAGERDLFSPKRGPGLPRWS
ncbi:hypothetical protein QIS74_00217 [Colletotrichum tabaci]|uniref:Uncharacterized protein n=1 Tax=Colletotrichum tabaci TaxID=1209068 RepID=A0AAV9TST4_9PEZI